MDAGYPIRDMREDVPPTEPREPIRPEEVPPATEPTPEDVPLEEPMPEDMPSMVPVEPLTAPPLEPAPEDVPLEELTPEGPAPGDMPAEPRRGI
ncbi:MAG: hypothetical protein JOZ19_01345 [Rubrobacter sp.]|nr:hypothetical protein [Rubrobacter sp.]